MPPTTALDDSVISAADLAEVARSLEPLCTASTPRWLRRKRLLPTPTRIGGAYFYPAYAPALLRADTRWRQRGVRDVEARRFLLWLEGFPLPLDDIRPLIAQVAQDWNAGRAELLSSLSVTPDSGAPALDMAAVESEAAQIAAMRSRSPLPEPMRKRRMSKREKEEAITFALLSLLNLVAAAADRAESAAAVDRLMGLDRRRKNMKPLLLAEDPLALSRFTDPAKFAEGANADDDEIEVGRRFLQLGFALGPAFVAVMALDLGPSVEQAWLMLQQTPAKFVGPMSALAVAAFAGAIRLNRAEIDVEWILENLDPSTVAFELHESLEKASERFAFRQALPVDQRDLLEQRLAGEAQPRRLQPRDTAP